MNKEVRHVMGISGGKDSAALAIYMHDKHPDIDIEYYFTDTGKELDEIYEVLDRLEVYLGKKIIRLRVAENSHKDPFDHHLDLYNGFLPSSMARWCTKKLKLKPFEDFVGNDHVISYVGIRADEDREGYVSTKSNIQSVFPFRRYIWSMDVLNRVMDDKNIDTISYLYKQIVQNNKLDRILEIVERPKTVNFGFSKKMNLLLDLGVTDFNKVVFQYLKGIDYPISNLDDYSLLYNEDELVRQDIFDLLENSGVGIPRYYKKIQFEVDGEIGEYSRSRSGCYFCFFQQKIEWVWLYEQHPDLFKKSMEYEKDGFKWMDSESLADLIKPERIKKIKKDFIKKSNKSKNNQSPYLIDLIEDAEGIGCANCFI